MEKLSTEKGGTPPREQGGLSWTWGLSALNHVPLLCLEAKQMTDSQ